MVEDSTELNKYQSKESDIMAEAIISRAGGSSGGQEKYNYVFTTELFIENKQWVVPKAKNQEFDVRIFGGGGGGMSFSEKNLNMSSGGGGGWMNNAILKLNENDTIPITVGLGGSRYIENSPTESVIIGTASSNDYVSANSGGTTFFGSYLSANGGEGGKVSGSKNVYGGNGGSGGGAYAIIYGSVNRVVVACGGIGYQFGGGGASGDGCAARGGNAYNFGGGGGAFTNVDRGINTQLQNLCMYGISEKYGNGGLRNNNKSIFKLAESGENVDGILNNELFDIAGYAEDSGYGGGGGGYGGNGGNGSGSGGGGYGATGGQRSCGGGGYGKAGSAMKNGTQITSGGGGGGSYGYGGIYNVFNGMLDGIRGGGGGGSYNGGAIASNGGNGICIIQYWKAIQIE